MSLTGSAPGGVSNDSAEGLTWLSAVNEDAAVASRSTNDPDPGSESAARPAAVLRIPSGATLEAGGRRVELHHVDGRTGGALAIYVRDAGTLFVGDLVGLGRGSDPLSIDAWIRSLQRLERLGPRLVVPGSGPVEGPEVLAATRTALERIKRRILGCDGRRHEP